MWYNMGVVGSPPMAMTTFSVCCVATSDIKNRVTMEPGFQPEVIQTFACPSVANDRAETWNAEDDGTWTYYVSEGQNPVDTWP